jgi:hypothetical protein
MLGQFANFSWFVKRDLALVGSKSRAWVNMKLVCGSGTGDIKVELWRALTTSRHWWRGCCK